MSRPSRREATVQHIRRDIVDAAARVFAAKGYGGASMADIATEAEFGTASLYSYFKGKQAIYEALVEATRKELIGLFDRELPAGLSLAQRLELRLRDVSTWIEERRDAILALTRTPPAEDPTAVDPRAIGMADFREILENHADAIDPMAPSEAAFLLSGIHQGYFLEWMAGGREGSLVDRSPRIVQIFLAACRNSEEPIE